MQLLLVQALNGLQFGVLLFLVAAGLTLVFGVMDFINLAHGVQYMLGAYLGASLAAATGSFWAGLLLALPAALACGLALEWLVFRHLYDRDHLSQVLATFGVILFLNEAVKAGLGQRAAAGADARPAAGRHRADARAAIPLYRLAILFAGLATAARSGCWWSARGSARWSAPGPATGRCWRRSASIRAGSSCWSSASAPCWRASPG